jgi:hypothetical protein
MDCTGILVMSRAIECVGARTRVRRQSAAEARALRSKPLPTAIGRSGWGCGDPGIGRPAIPMMAITVARSFNKSVSQAPFEAGNKHVGRKVRTDRRLGFALTTVP